MVADRALKGDRERCLEAGMDGYVSKPLRRDDLLAAMRDVRDRSKATVTSARAAWNREGALARAGGDPVVLAEIAALFLQDLGSMLTNIANGVAAGDPKAVEQAAHRLRSSASFFEARDLLGAAERLENMGRAGDLTDAAPCWSELQQNAVTLERALAGMEEGA